MKIKLKNRIDVLMRDCGVRTVEELSRRLSRNQDYSITRTPLSRKVNSDDVQLPLSLIEALCNELQCLPGDLFQIDVVDATPEWVEEIQSRVPPFRYGSMRMRKPGELGSASDATPEAPVAVAGPVQSRPRASKPVDPTDDGLAGPKVTHLDVSKLKKR
ncbi:MAG: helix-turn-helix transcriptional regulator [Proteobacteria bacterium]|nr:helix-turn-helix transcriptional regulator [Pseudomonadota bacterium]MBS0461949.1 helix-turn-helix transcriptional regulator [Pseudomonadota bacterium]MBS0463607.1 helix-turn-helix transcriptional regulator [Pseudomonadota bacterium]